MKGSRASVDTPTLALIFFVTAFAALAYFVFSGAFVSEQPARLHEQMIYTKISEVDVREILEKAYLKAAQEAGVGGNSSQADVDMLFSQYATEWLQSYFKERGLHNVSVSISPAVPEEQEYSHGAATELRYGRYVVTVSAE